MISLRLQPHHIETVRVFRELMRTREYSKAQLEGADKILHSSKMRSAQLATHAGKKARLSFQAAIWDKLPPPPTLQQSTGNLVYPWSPTDSKTLWEARLKVGEGIVGEVGACRAQVKKLQPVPNERTSIVPGYSWDARLLKLSAVGDRRPAAAPPLYAPPRKRLAV